MILVRHLTLVKTSSLFYRNQRNIHPGGIIRDENHSAGNGGPMSWKIIDHEADSGLEAHGDTLDELFTESASAFLFLCSGKSISSLLEEVQGTGHISLEAADLEELVVSWLNEILFLAETRSFFFIPSVVRVRTSPYSLYAEGRTAPCGTGPLPVKAATYSDLAVQSVPAPYLRVIVDM